MRDYEIERHELKLLRRRGGALLRRRRLLLGLTQRQIAELVGIHPYTIVAQLESGIGRIEPNQYQRWADALKLPLRVFVSEVLRHLDPVAHHLFVPNTDQRFHCIKFRQQSKADL
ncbi:helix-turn-helix transcriptional regulator [uncultured Bradyrhizobium sp.]|uniref:helix-turn-helix domain-containing protein n=1 Tax=uncultured Bradyrhizobium sp. TaxID=199684 RepID=UPI0034219B3A